MDSTSPHVIKQFLKLTFKNKENLAVFCYDYFHDVYAKLSQKTTLEDAINALINYVSLPLSMRMQNHPVVGRRVYGTKLPNPTYYKAPSTKDELIDFVKNIYPDATHHWQKAIRLHRPIELLSQCKEQYLRQKLVI